uniref:Peptidase A2 domain-containing protein n=1 Tax=Mycena chlorophos TaxID=658473 RepID=A0ABQ0LA60_MYCCL|nr:predicted protein [Mycena chlorophos]
MDLPESVPMIAQSLVRGLHRNARRAAKFTKTPGWKKKGKEKDTGEVVLPRRVRRRRALAVSTEDRRKLELQESPSEGFIRAHKVRDLPDRMGSLGTKALHTKVRVGALDAEEVRGQLDSGADITLMSEEFWAALPDKPKPREGVRMKLYHLTG